MPNAVVLTVLPNGLTDDGTQLRLTVLVTPVADSGSLTNASPFYNWPNSVGNLSWQVTLQPLNAPVPPSPTPLPSTPPATPLSQSAVAETAGNLNSSLWKAIFGDHRTVAPRTGNSAFFKAWRISHDISTLHENHEDYRLFHAEQRLLSSALKQAKRAVQVAQTHDQRRTAQKIQATITTARQLADAAIAAGRPPVLYIYPSLGDDSGSYSAQIAARNAALAFVNNAIDSANITGADAQAIKNRIQYAVNLLEHNTLPAKDAKTPSHTGKFAKDSEKLKDVALFAIYLNCIQSVRAPGTSPDTPPQDHTTEDFRLYTLYQTVKNAYLGSDDLEKVGRYIAMHLFHRRLSHRVMPLTPRPDFHQLLGMVNHYPSMMRQLGLAFDLVTKLPPVDGYYLISATPTENGTANQLGTLTPILNTTYCCYAAPIPAHANIAAIPGKFYAVSIDPYLIKERMLNLGAVDPDAGLPLFRLVSEDADGTALKQTDQINNTARAGEYASSAPTSMKKKAPYQPGPSDPGEDTPSAVPNPTDAPPSPRTVGIALFASSRLGHLEGVVARAPAPATAATTSQSFYADDLVLGYRVDVLYKNTWYSLCDRSSQYDVHDIDHLATIVYKGWKPSTKAEIDADQGYIGFAATQTPADDSGDTQTQVHQTVFTWTGWSLSVPHPKFPVFDQPPTGTPSDSDKPLSVYPKYELVDKEKVLPPLRFDTDYSFRCRVVDIAGNSAPLASHDDSLDGVTLQPNTQFSRQEPIRAPQFLLTHPIDRIEHPGEHIDRMVARDYDSHSSRILIAPRESLRLAELHGKLTSSTLPSSAFSSFQLMDDGSFPDVTTAINNHWASGPNDDRGNRDAIFLPRREGGPTNPYYPDPLANYIRIDAYLISDNPNVSRPLGITQFIPIVTDLPWPERAPVRVRMQPTRRRNTPDPTFDFVRMTDSPDPDFGDATIAELMVTVPYAQTVVLSICSVAVNSTAQPDPGAGTVRVHLSNLHDLYKSNTSAEVAALDIGSGPETLLASALTGISPDYLNSNSFVNGSLDLVTPARTMTLVHAVKQPLDPPDFAPPSSAGHLTVERDFGGTQAAVHAMIEASWISTGKISCQADWTDCVDDIKQPRPSKSRTQETAFTFTADQTFEYNASQALVPPQPRYDDSPPYLRVLAPYPVTPPTGNPGLIHAFRDTRAHTVTYSLVASTRFRDYYPASDKTDSDFQIAGRTTRTITVLSSVRPPALSIAYIIPAFEWRDTYDAKSKTWFSGRNAVLRVYLNRPFCVSGDKEGVGVVLVSKSNPSAPATQNLVSRWGSDPIHKIVTQISSPELTSENFCQAEDAVQTCMLSEIKNPNGTTPTDGSNLADIKPYPVHYAEDHGNNRQMWFADIPVNTAGSYAPFMRLALVRWQPEALHNSTDDARISQVVFADFMQISVDRWVSIERRDGKTYTITVSGVFAQDLPGCVDPKNNPTFTCRLFSRWYALGKDMGWRPMSFDITFCYSPAPLGSSISTWTADLKLPHSAFDQKYRILISEREWFPPNPVGRLIYEQFVDLP